MKKLILFFTLTISVFLFSCNGKAQTNNADITSNKKIVQVIDFHSTNRCITCKAIEKKSLEALEKNFKEELENGTITFQTINVDNDENYAVAEEFQATGTALFLNIISGDQSKKVDLTEFAFMRAKIPDNSFENGFTREVKKALKMIENGVVN
jgi:hypothetical protein